MELPADQRSGRQSFYSGPDVFRRIIRVRLHYGRSEFEGYGKSHERRNDGGGQAGLQCENARRPTGCDGGVKVA